MKRISKRRLATLRQDFKFNPDVLALIEHYERKPDVSATVYASDMLARGVWHFYCHSYDGIATRQAVVEVYYVKRGKR
jgi:hypothetical protein